MLQHLRWSFLWQLLKAESCEQLTQGASSYMCMGSRSPLLIDRIVSCVSPTVLAVQRKVVANIFFKKRLRRSLAKRNFITKIIKISNICYFWRIFWNTYQNANWLVNIFVSVSWSQVKYSFLHDLASGKPSLLTSSSNRAFKTYYVFFAIAEQVK